MLDQTMRITAASIVLLGGIAVASLFRHDSPRASPPAAKPGDRLVLKQPESLANRPRILEPHSEGFLPSDSLPADPKAMDQGAAVFRPPAPGEPPPRLARTYPDAGTAVTSRWGTSIGLPLPESSRADQTPQAHTIVDGDTLEGLAERYLGSTDRALEIYEANRDVLSSPQLLPIGAELKIPPPNDPPNHPPHSASAIPAPRRLVPIQREPGGED